MEMRSVNLEGDGHGEDSIHGVADHRFLKQVESGLPVKDICRQGGLSKPTPYTHVLQVVRQVRRHGGRRGPPPEVL